MDRAPGNAAGGGNLFEGSVRGWRGGIGRPAAGVHALSAAAERVAEPGADGGDDRGLRAIHGGGRRIAMPWKIGRERAKCSYAIEILRHGFGRQILPAGPTVSWAPV